MSIRRVNEVLSEAAKKVGKTSGKIAWEFDLTQFASPKVWQSVVKALGAKGGKKFIHKRKKTFGGGYWERTVWVWKAPGLRIETNANPMTGEKSMGGHNEPGYASYIYLEGDTAKVKKAAALISKKAEYIKSDRKGEQLPARDER